MWFFSRYENQSLQNRKHHFYTFLRTSEHKKGLVVVSRDGLFDIP